MDLTIQLLYFWLEEKIIVIKKYFTRFYYKALLIQNFYFDVTDLDAHEASMIGHYFN